MKILDFHLRAARGALPPRPAASRAPLRVRDAGNVDVPECLINAHPDA